MEPKLELSNINFVTKDGKPFKINPEGSLGLLAYGYLGLLAWREARKKIGTTTSFTNEKIDSEDSTKTS